MKYEVKFTNQFKKDLKLAKKKAEILTVFMLLLKNLPMMNPWNKNIATMI